MLALLATPGMLAFALTSLVLAMAADVVTTLRALDRGAIESNPLYCDETPSLQRLLIVNVTLAVAVIGAALLCGPDPYVIPLILVVAASRVFVAWRNTRVAR